MSGKSVWGRTEYCPPPKGNLSNIYRERIKAHALCESAFYSAIQEGASVYRGKEFVPSTHCWVTFYSWGWGPDNGMSVKIFDSSTERSVHLTETFWVIERRIDGRFTLNGPQPDDVFGIKAITGITDWEMSRVIFARKPDAELDGRFIPDWPRVLDPDWVARKKTW